MIVKVFNRQFLLCLLIALVRSTHSEESYPTIHDVVSFKRPKQQARPEERVDVESDLTIDIEKLDMQRLKKDDSAFRHQIMGDIGGELLEYAKENNARRVQAFYPKKGLTEYYKAYELQYRTKMADCMLQLIYMARSKIKSFQAQGFVKKQSSEYRVGFLIRKLDSLYFKARRYLTVMVMRQSERNWDTESTGILNLHHKVVMAHQDFNRYFRMQAQLHERLELIEGRQIHSMSEAGSTTTVVVEFKRK